MLILLIVGVHCMFLAASLEQALSKPLSQSLQQRAKRAVPVAASSSSDYSSIIPSAFLHQPEIASPSNLRGIRRPDLQMVKKDYSELDFKTTSQKISSMPFAPPLEDFQVSQSTFAPSSLHYTPKRWINDPCGLWYNPITQEYQLNVQYNPFGFTWGHMHWLSLSSKDLITFVERGISMTPLGDKLAGENHVFTGMTVPKGIEGKPTVFYTSISFKDQESFGWMKPYRRDVNKERVAMATSSDGGVSWDKREIIIPEAPTNYNPTGWRDPFVFQHPELSKAFQRAGRLESEFNKDTWFMLLGSGEQHVGGRFPIYSSLDLKRWKYESLPFFAHEGVREKSWKPSFGMSFETVSLFKTPSALHGLETKTQTLNNDYNVIFFGTEGYRTSNPEGHSPLWMIGSLDVNTNSQSVSLQKQAVGALDHGNYYYAPALLSDPKHGDRKLVIGWIKEDQAIAAKQKWAGTLSLPRLLEMTLIKNVYIQNPMETLSLLPDRGFLVHDMASSLHPSSSIQDMHPGAKIVTLETLGIKPMPELTSGSLSGTKIASLPSQSLEGPASRIMTSAKSTSFHVHAQFTIDAKTNPIVGLTIRSTPDGTQETQILYDHLAKLFKIIRPHPSDLASLRSSLPEQAEFELFQVVAPDGKSVETERLELRVFVDNSVVEVFANGRFALSTRIYPTVPDADGIGVVGSGGSARLLELKVYDFTKNSNMGP